MDVSKGRALLPYFPVVLKPYVIFAYPADPADISRALSVVAFMVSHLNERIDTCLEYIREPVNERLQKMRAYGNDWHEKPVRICFAS